MRALLRIGEARVTDEAPLFFERRLGGLFPANAAARDAVAAIEGKVTVKITRANRNQRRRALYWLVASIVTPLLNDMHGLDLTESELHDLTRKRLGMVDHVVLPSGDTIERLHSTSDGAMQEPARAAFTDKAFRLWSRWVGVPVDTLTQEAQAA